MSYSRAISNSGAGALNGAHIGQRQICEGGLIDPRVILR